MFSDIEIMGMMIGNPDVNSIKRELKNVYDRSLETGKDRNFDDKNIGGNLSQN